MKPETSKQTSFPPIVFQDNDVVVINKPSGLIVQLSHTHNQPTLESMLTDHHGLERRGIVHRLDRDTSGLMVVAKSGEAQQALHQQFQQRQVAKRYQALVWGKFPDEHAIIDAPIARHPLQGHKFTAMADGKDAKTEVWRQQTYRLDDQWLSLLRVVTHTGRTHQIRVHLQALGYPLVGDIVYGRRKDPRQIRLFLHADYLAFNQPSTGQRLEFVLPLADDLAEFIGSLTSAD